MGKVVLAACRGLVCVMGVAGVGVAGGGGIRDVVGAVVGESGRVVEGRRVGPGCWLGGVRRADRAVIKAVAAADAAEKAEAEAAVAAAAVAAAECASAVAVADLDAAVAARKAATAAAAAVEEAAAERESRRRAAAGSALAIGAGR